MFFKVVMPRYFSTSNVRAFHFCYVPAKTCCCQSLSYSHSRGSLSTSYLLCHSVFHHFWAWSRTITELYPCIYDSFLPQIPFSILRPPYPWSPKLQWLPDFHRHTWTVLILCSLITYLFWTRHVQIYTLHRNWSVHCTIIPVTWEKDILTILMFMLNSIWNTVDADYILNSE